MVVYIFMHLCSDANDKINIIFVYNISNIFFALQNIYIYIYSI